MAKKSYPCSVDGCEKRTSLPDRGICLFHFKKTDAHKEKEKEYYQNNKDKWKTPENVERQKQYQKEYIKTDNFKHLSRERRLAKEYKMSVSDFNDLLAKQGHRCKICKVQHSEKKLAVDHDHRTGLVRGLLCTHCNIRLGFFEKDPVFFLFSIDRYLTCQ